jgi:hypothetical protein
MQNKIRDTKNNKEEDGRFKKKNIKHDPQAESSRITFSFPREEHLD